MRNTLREYIFAAFTLFAFCGILIGAIAQSQIARQKDYKKELCGHYNPTVKAVCKYKINAHAKA